MSTATLPQQPMPNTEELLALKQLVQDSLAKRGVLGRLKAELRANVFAVLSDRPSVLSGAPPNQKLQRLKATREGRILLDMMTEFMEFFDMRHTLATFTAEASMPDKFDAALRPVICREIQMPPPADPDDPLLMSLLRHFEQLSKSGPSMKQSHPELRRSVEALAVSHAKFVPPPVHSPPQAPTVRSETKVPVLDDTQPAKSLAVGKPLDKPTAQASVTAPKNESPVAVQKPVAEEVSLSLNNSLSDVAKSDEQLKSGDLATSGEFNSSSSDSVDNADVKPIFSFNQPKPLSFTVSKVGALPPLSKLPPLQPSLPPVTPASQDSKPAEEPNVHEEDPDDELKEDPIFDDVHEDLKLKEEPMILAHDRLDDRLLTTTSPPPNWESDANDEAHTADESLDDLGSISDVVNEFDYTESVELA